MIATMKHYSLLRLAAILNSGQLTATHSHNTLQHGGAQWSIGSYDT